MRTASQVIELAATQGAIVMSKLGDPPEDKTRNNTNSKTGDVFLSTELARRLGPPKGIASVTQNPGSASTDLFRHTPWVPYLAWPLVYDTRSAAYTELYSGLSRDIELESNGCYVLPRGRASSRPREDLVQVTRLEEGGGIGRAKEVVLGVFRGEDTILRLITTWICGLGPVTSNEGPACCCTIEKKRT